MKLKSLAIIAALGVAVVLGARVVSAFIGGIVVNGSFAVSQVIPIFLGVNGAQNISAVVSYSSPAFSAATFTTGQVSTGSITIASNAALSTAAATDSIVVNSTSGALGDFVTMSYPIPPGAAVVRVNRDWIYGATVSSAATNLAAALSRYSGRLGGVQFVASGNVVYATAPVSALYNNIHVVTNDPTTLTVAHATFVGGQTSATVYVSGYRFQANRDYVVGGSASASATNLAAAINARAGLNALVTATPSGAAVNLVSKAAGATYALSTTNPAAASVSAAFTYGAVAPSWVLNSSEINVPNHGFVTGLPVLYSVGSGAPAITGLTSQTTYYVGVLDVNDVALASSRSNAAAGTFIALASSSTLTAAKTYNLSPLAFSAGSAGFNWEVSNDGTNWTLLNVSSLNYTSPGSEAWSFGAVPFKYLGLNLTAPTAGALTIQVNAQGN